MESTIFCPECGTPHSETEHSICSNCLRQMFEGVEAHLTTDEEIDRVRMVKEFFTNPAFRRAIQEMTARIIDSQ